MTLLRTTRGGKTVEFALATGGVLLGTAPGCQIVVADPAAAPKHCKIVRSSQGFVVTDLSSGGTVVNGAKIKEHVLKNGDILQIGSEKFTFVERVAEPVGAAKAAAPASAAAGGGAPAASAGGRRPLPARPAVSGARAAGAAPRKLTPKPGAIARVHKDKHMFVLPSTAKGKTIALVAAIGIVVLGGVLFALSANTKNSEQVKKQAEQAMKELAQIPETDFEKRLAMSQGILSDPDYAKYAPDIIYSAKKVRDQAAQQVELQKRANATAKPFIERYRALKNGPPEDFKPKYDGLYDEVKALLEQFEGTTFATELAAIKAELKELMEKIGPGWNEELPKLLRDVQKQIDTKNFNQALVEVETFATKFKDTDSSTMKSQMQELRTKIQRLAKEWVEDLKKTAAQKTTKEEKRRVLETARPFLQGCAEALKELEKAIREL